MNKLCAMIAGVVIVTGVQAEDLWKVDPKVLSCSPVTLNATGTLVLSLGPKHGQELAIQRHVDGVWFFLVVGLAPSDMKSLMTREEFSRARRVPIKADQTGYAWVEGRGNERVFTASGNYSVYVSEVLESERGGHVCTITYAP